MKIILGLLIISTGVAQAGQFTDSIKAECLLTGAIDQTITDMVGIDEVPSGALDVIFSKLSLHRKVRVILTKDQEVSDCFPISEESK
jgi:hypothetical protein